MSQTIIGVFDTPSDAQQAAQELTGMGISQSQIRISSSAQSTTSAGSSADDKGFWENVKDAFGFGDDDDRHGLREASRRGGTIVTVAADDASVAGVEEVMRRHNVVNLDDRARQWGTEGWAGYQQYQAAQAQPAMPATAQAHASNVSQGEEAIPVVQEELHVGKRSVSRGGVRVVSRVTETPVEQQVALREEHVHVERRPVNRPVTDATMADAFRERTIEATETAEQAVVAKEARVVEEVVVSKDVDQRTETVRDSVRRTDVDVQRTEGSDDRFRPAYEFADELSADTRYHGRAFDDAEPDIRQSFEQRNPNSRWDEVRDAVRSRYNRSRSNA